MCFEPRARRWENSYFLLKVLSSPRRWGKSAESAGESLGFTSAETRQHPKVYLHFTLICIGVCLHMRVYVCVCVFGFSRRRPRRACFTAAGGVFTVSRLNAA